jgi:RHS repeat-associated protein
MPAGYTWTFYEVDDRNPSGYPQVLEEYRMLPNGAALLNRAYNYGLSLISQQQYDTNTLLPSGISYYGFDGHGSVRFLTDTNETITDTYVYDAYGTAIATSANTPNNYLYCGEQFDFDLGLYYLRARYYRPDTGRFWTMDTYQGTQEDPLSLHKYVFCRNSPINNLDPSGHISVKRLTPDPLDSSRGSYDISWEFTLDKSPPEDGYIVQYIPIQQDQMKGSFSKSYWEAWFIPATKTGTPSVHDTWSLPSSDALIGSGSTHTTIKYFFKRNTGDLGDYNNPPAKPDPTTGWHPGDGKNWSLDLPWTEKKPTWWEDKSDNGEADAGITLDTKWKWEQITPKIMSLDFEDITVIP